MKPIFLWVTAAAALVVACLAGFLLGTSGPTSPVTPSPVSMAHPVSKPAAVAPQTALPPTAAAPAPASAALDLEAHGRSLARQGIEVVLAFLETLQHGDQQSLFLRGAFKYVAGISVDEALAWAGRLAEPQHRETALLTLLESWGGSAAEGSDTAATALRLGAFLLDRRRATPEQVLALANQFLTGEPRAYLLALVVNALFAANADPAKTLALGEGLEGKAREIFYSQYAMSWASKDALGARAWATGITDEELRMDVLAEVLVMEAQTDITAALAHLNELPAGHPRRISVARQLAARLGSQDPAAVRQWLESLPPGLERDAVAHGLGDLAPVGIGVAIGQADADGYISVQAVQPEGIAGRTRALQPGDRIIAITDSNGAWLSLRGRPLQEIVDLIRGPQGSTVTLQVLPAGATAPKTIRLPRQPINVQSRQD